MAFDFDFLQKPKLWCSLVAGAIQFCPIVKVATFERVCGHLAGIKAEWVHFCPNLQPLLFHRPLVAFIDLVAFVKIVLILFLWQHYTKVLNADDNSVVPLGKSPICP